MSQAPDSARTGARRAQRSALYGTVVVDWLRDTGGTSRAARWRPPRYRYLPSRRVQATRWLRSRLCRSRLQLRRVPRTRELASLAGTAARMDGIARMGRRSPDPLPALVRQPGTTKPKST